MKLKGLSRLAAEPISNDAVSARSVPGDGFVNLGLQGRIEIQSRS